MGHPWVTVSAAGTGNGRVFLNNGCNLADDLIFFLGNGNKVFKYCRIIHNLFHCIHPGQHPDNTGLAGSENAAPRKRLMPEDDSPLKDRVLLPAD